MLVREPAPRGAPSLDSALARLGYPSFRPGQREAIETLLERGRLLLVAPTGGGKSLIYQLPATVLPGTTLVISPLVALMTDQVQALEARGVAATFLASTLDAGEMRQPVMDAEAGRAGFAVDENACRHGKPHGLESPQQLAKDLIDHEEADPQLQLEVARQAVSAAAGASACLCSVAAFCVGVFCAWHLA